MDEPPTKRPRRDERDRDREVHTTLSPRSPRSQEERKPNQRTNGYDSRRRDRDDDRRRKRSRSRSPVRDRYAGSRRDRSRERDKPFRERDRDRDLDGERHAARPRRDRDGDGRRKRSRSRSRSQSPYRNGSNAPTRGGRPANHDRDRDRNAKTEPRSGTVTSTVKKSDSSEAMDLIPMKGEDEEAVMKRIMGFGTFRTTKNTKVPGNQIYGVRKEKKTTYRQYMNRVGGFNRPLSPTRI